MVRLQDIKLRPPFGEDSVIWREYTDFFRNAYDLPYAHKIKRRFYTNEPLSINDIHPHWLFDKDIQGNYVVTDPLEHVQNPTISSSTRRPKGELGKKREEKRRKENVEGRFVNETKFLAIRTC
jgi:hypothetical protein